MLNNFLTKFALVKPLLMEEEPTLQSINNGEYEKSGVLIYFSTSWCSPCKNMAPLIDEVSKHYAEHLKVIKIDVDEQLQLAKELEVTGVPTLVLLNQSGVNSRLIGGVNADDINRWLKKELNQPII